MIRNHTQLAIDTGLGATATASGLVTKVSLPTLIGRIIGATLSLIGVVLAVLLIYGGFLWMTAQGNEEKIKKAKSILTNAVIGMILIFAAYAITQFVVSAIATATAQ